MNAASSAVSRIEIVNRHSDYDSLGGKTWQQLQKFTAFRPHSIRTARIYLFFDLPQISDEQLLEIGQKLFSDPILDETFINTKSLADQDYNWYVEVSFLPGVTDNQGRTASQSLLNYLAYPAHDTPSNASNIHLNNRLNNAARLDVHFAQGYFFDYPQAQRSDIVQIAQRWLYNPLIQQASILERGQTTELLNKLPVIKPANPPSQFYNPQQAEFDNIATELGLSTAEIACIKQYFSQPEAMAKRCEYIKQRNISAVELEVLAQTWSEHCKHKIFNARINYTDYSGAEPQTQHIDSLYKTYIQGATQQVRKNHDLCVSVFDDNAGVIKFNDSHHIVFKVETHNTPSALDPYGGALTGIVGVNRDPFGTGLGADLICNTDVFCFAPPFYKGNLPPRVMHPQRIYEGVRLGVEHGGNKSGIPTVNGSVVFQPDYLCRPLVFCGTGGLLAKTIAQQPGHKKTILPGDRIVMVGGRIGKDGIHGATTSSREWDEKTSVNAVQIGDPIVQKKMFDYLRVARDKGLYRAITDNGAGGLSSSVGEMALLSGGADLNLSHAPLKYANLAPWEVMVSESQERMTLAVAPEKLDELLKLATAMDSEATDIGQFTDNGMFIARWHNEVVAALDLNFMHKGLPALELDALHLPPPLPIAPTVPRHDDWAAVLHRLLGQPNICSKESLVRQYDHEVQGASVIKPLVGINNDGPSDCAVIRPQLSSAQGLAIGHGICPRYSPDAYKMAQAAFDEALRNIVAGGADPRQMTALDNFCWSNPLPAADNPQAQLKLGQLVRACQALYESSTTSLVAFISGKDSMKNDYVENSRWISTPPTVLITALGIVNNIEQAISMDVKMPQHSLYLVGQTKPELGRSEYYMMQQIEGGIIPTTNPQSALQSYIAIHQQIESNNIVAAHDCSDGGLAVALAEMAFSGGRGIEVDLKQTAGSLSIEECLFAESTARIIVEVVDDASFEAALHNAGVTFSRLGRVTDSELLNISCGSKSIIVDNIYALKQSWQAPFKDL